MLTGRRVLIAEDEPLLALDLSLSIEEARGEVVGPVATVAEALALIEREPVEAAILDVHLADRDIAPVAEALLARGVAVLFHTASAVPGEIARKFGAVPVCPKPMPPQAVLDTLARALAAAEET